MIDITYYTNIIDIIHLVMPTNHLETQFIAHGGMSTPRFQENTLTAYLEASKYKPLAIEMDVVLHPDTNQLICFHPQGLSSGKGTYDAQTIKAQLDDGAGFELLKEVIARVKEATPDYQNKFLIDIKQPEDPHIFEVLLNDPEINHRDIVVGVRDLDKMAEIQELANDVDLLALFSDPDLYEEFANKGGKYFRLWEKDVTPERVEAIQNLGLEVWVTPGHKATKVLPRTAGEVNPESLPMLLGVVNAVLVNDVEEAIGIQEQKMK
jgi:glycerophosphoryl diester phosphodiesterase